MKTKTKFKLVASVTVTIYTEVEAETLEEAIEIAEERDMMDVPYINDTEELERWVCPTLDGEPVDIQEQ